MNAPCADNPHPFDVLIDITSGPEHRRAIEQARAICAGCPVIARCYRDNRREPWVQAITGRKLDPTSRPTCGNSQGVRLHSANGELQCDTCRAYSRRMNQRKIAKQRAAREAA